MKLYSTYLIVLLCCQPLKAIAQYGIDGAVFGLSHGIKWESTEKPRLKNIIDGQDKLIITNTALALSQAKLLNNKKIQYQSLSKTDKTIQESTLILQAIESGNSLVNIQTQTFEIVEGYPIIEKLIIPSETDLIIESYILLKDIYIAITEGEANLMNSAERLLLMKDILSRLNLLNELAVKIYYQADQLVSLEKLALIEDKPIRVPIGNVMEEIRKEIESIIK